MIPRRPPPSFSLLVSDCGHNALCPMSHHHLSHRLEWWWENVCCSCWWMASLFCWQKGLASLQASVPGLPCTCTSSDNVNAQSEEALWDLLSTDLATHEAVPQPAPPFWVPASCGPQFCCFWTPVSFNTARLSLGSSASSICVSMHRRSKSTPSDSYISQEAHVQ